MSWEPNLFDPGKWISPGDDVAIIAAFDEVLSRADILCASATYESLWPVLRLFQRARVRQPEVITILGGPHVDETYELKRFSDAGLHGDVIDYTIAGDADFALLALLRGVSSENHEATQLCVQTECLGKLFIEVCLFFTWSSASVTSTDATKPR